MDLILVLRATPLRPTARFGGRGGAPCRVCTASAVAQSVEMGAVDSRFHSPIHKKKYIATEPEFFAASRLRCAPKRHSEPRAWHKLRKTRFKTRKGGEEVN